MGNNPSPAGVAEKCPICNDLQPSGKRSKRAQVNLNKLREKCGYCQLLKSAVARLAYGKLAHVFVQTKKGQPIRVTYYREGGKNPGVDPAHIAEFIIYSHEESQLIPELGTLSPYPTSTNLDTSINFITKQLETCLTKHHKCRKLYESPLPTRVLSIGSLDSNVRLVELKDVRARYATLSHCWGNKQPLRTLASNIADMKKAIDFHTLPIVFQQAISVVRMLKVEYIWIDSLCIIQDSQSDWEREAAQMCDYYENSFLTISTAASPDPTVPFLGPRDDIWLPVELELATSKGKEPVYVQRLAKTPDQNGKLFSRAWTWQEAALSTRTTYFTPSELIWECLTQAVPQRYVPDLAISDIFGFSKTLFDLSSALSQSDTLPSDVNLAESQEELSPLSYDSDSTSTSSSSSIRVPPPRSVPDTRRPSSSGSSSCDTDMMDGIWDLWDELVGYYSPRQLTFATDKLPALSGVASRVHKATQSRYLAGIWEENLVINLCWARLDFGGTPALMSLPTAYVAPSWSWASVLGRVEHHVERSIQTFEPSFTIIEADCHVPGLNPFGRVSTGHLVLRGPMAEITVTSENSAKAFWYVLSGSQDKWRFYPDSALVSSGGNISRAREGQSLSNFRVKVLCLYLGLSYGTLQTKKVDKGDHYMMLLGKSENQDGSFCRVGLASSKKNSLFKGSSEREIKLL